MCIACFLSHTDTELCEWDIKSVDLINCYIGVIKRGCCLMGMRSEIQEILHTRGGERVITSFVNFFKGSSYNLFS